MAVTPVPRPAGSVSRAVAPEARRDAWLVLATDGPAARLAEILTGRDVVVVTESSRFRDALLSMRPRGVVCCRPPATLRDLQLVQDERRRRPSMRAVLVAPPEAVDARLDALARGFDDALASTVPLDELVGRLAWLDTRPRPRPAASEVLRFGDGFELDVRAHELRRRGEPIHLRPKEFGLLALLAAHPGRAYTRAELLDRVWESPRTTGRTVDVHVRWLRSKIEAEPNRPVLLVTVRGIGYRLDPVRR